MGSTLRHALQITLPRAKRALLAAAVAALMLAMTLAGDRAPRAAIAATLPAGFTESTIASGMSSPTAMAVAPDGRVFVAEQTGSLRVIKNDALLATPFVTLTVDSSGERGMLGVAFDPNFASNHYVYIYYTTPSPAVHNRLSRFTANGDVAVPGSEVVLLDLNNLSGATNHNGGAIHFGPDGKLYVAVGENANGANAQSMSNLLGKMLRINSDGSTPPDNPFYGTATGQNRLIWAMGLRNPFTFSFQPGTGRMFINDVGQSTWEEIDDGIAGSNYGWPTTEGVTSNPSFRSPLYVYNHSSGTPTGCAITGGTFYNAPVTQFPASYAGKYFFSDYCGGWIYVFNPATGTATSFASGIGAPVDLQVAADGSLYYLYRGSGAVNRIRYTASQAPAITQHPANTTVTEGHAATFTVAASGTAPLSYQWQRNNVNIGGATSPTYTLASPQLADSGVAFRCVVTNAFGSATSNAATLTVTANIAPTATITSPSSGTTYAAGDTINYSGTGTDPEDGMLPASAFTWQVDFHHDAHTHPFIPATSGAKSGSFVIPTSGETSANVWYRIHLTVTDSGGLTHSVYRDVTPRTVTMIIASSPQPNAQITLDGQPHTAPYVVTGVVGMTRSIGVTTPQTIAGTQWTFASWSGGGAATHNITTPASNAVYVVRLRSEISRPPNETVAPVAAPAGTIAPSAPSTSRSATAASSAAAPPRSAGAVLASTVESMTERLRPLFGAPPESTIEPAPAASNSAVIVMRIARLRAWREAVLSAPVERPWWDASPRAIVSRMLHLAAYPH